MKLYWLRFLRALNLAPYSLVLKQGEAYSSLRASLDAVEIRMWKRYEARLRNDLSMTLSWLYTQHVTKVSLGRPETQEEGTWPYYSLAKRLANPPEIQAERVI